MTHHHLPLNIKKKPPRSLLSVNFPIIMIIITLLIPTEVITSLNPFSILMMKRNHPCCVIIICLLHTTINASKLSYSIYYKNLPSLIVTRKYTHQTHHQLFPTDTFQIQHTLLLVGETVRQAKIFSSTLLTLSLSLLKHSLTPS